MKFQGYLYKPDKKQGSPYWSVEVPILEIYTQGRSKKNALFMIQDAIEEVIHKKGVKINIRQSKDNLLFTVESNNSKELVAFMLRQQRATNRLTLEDVRERLKAKSCNTYARYEQGRALPSLDTLSELLKAVGGKEPILTIE